MWIALAVLLPQCKTNRVIEGFFVLGWEVCSRFQLFLEVVSQLLDFICLLDRIHW
jgi:hypothetical protein